MKKTGFGLVRKKDGTPRIEGDPKKLHPAIQMQMTKKERKDLGLWDGAWARDAQGFKRLNKISQGYEAVDALVAVSEIFDDKKYYRLSQRVDVPTNGTIHVNETLEG